jgi:hypothetical protein
MVLWNVKGSQHSTLHIPLRYRLLGLATIYATDTRYVFFQLGYFVICSQDEGV